MTNDKFHLNIPSKSDYISVVRLTTSGICSHMNFNVDDIDDIKVCVSEACNNVLGQGEIEEISIDFEREENKLKIRVKDVSQDLEETISSGHDRELGLLIISSLMDNVEFTNHGIEMLKYIE